MVCWQNKLCEVTGPPQDLRPREKPSDGTVQKNVIGRFGSPIRNSSWIIKRRDAVRIISTVQVLDQTLSWTFLGQEHSVLQVSPDINITVALRKWKNEFQPCIGLLEPSAYKHGSQDVQSSNQISIFRPWCIEVNQSILNQNHSEFLFNHHV